MKSKTNRRVKRVKKTRRNRRSRRTQRGGGKFGDSIKLHYSRVKECEQKCYTDNPDPLKKYTQEHPTPSGWYIDSRSAGGHGHGIDNQIKNKSLDIIISAWDKNHKPYLDMLEELPDPTKTYTTGGWGFTKKWKLKYNAVSNSLEWENQENQTIKLFVIASPLNIGDSMATQIT